MITERRKYADLRVGDVFIRTDRFGVEHRCTVLEQLPSSPPDVFGRVYPAVRARSDDGTEGLVPYGPDGFTHIPTRPNRQETPHMTDPATTEHRDIGQRYLKLDDSSHDFWTFCTCGQAFRGLDPDGADAGWSAHADRPVVEVTELEYAALAVMAERGIDDALYYARIGAEENDRDDPGYSTRLIAAANAAQSVLDMVRDR